MPNDTFDDKSALVQVMAWCHQARSHYLTQCWPSSMMPFGVTRPQWVNSLWPSDAIWCQKHLSHAIIKTNDDIFTIRSLGKNFSEIRIKIHFFRSGVIALSHYWLTGVHGNSDSSENTAQHWELAYVGGSYVFLVTRSLLIHMIATIWKKCIHVCRRLTGIDIP